VSGWEMMEMICVHKKVSVYIYSSVKKVLRVMVAHSEP
jgi:hypothetical protein